MIRLVDRKDCCGCGACAAACPHDAISMLPDGMGFRYPVVDFDACVDCHFCEEICAFAASSLRGREPRAEAIRFPELMDRSQSGGLAFALMRKAVRGGMVVYGAAMDEDFVVRHRRVEAEGELEPLRLSKYVQSEMQRDYPDKPGNDVIASECGQSIPRMVLADLQAGRRVLFTGTPCQCAGVGRLCRPYRDRLLLMDIVCHGVPAPYVWRDYLAEQERRHGRKLTRVLFRDPSLGWHTHREALWFGEEKLVSDEYTDLFYRHLMLRPSCTVCPFASLSRPGDITAADCWGVEKALPGFADDNRGCSLMLLNTPAGEGFVREFPGETVLRQRVDVRLVMQANFLAPSTPKDGADLFENTYIRRGYPVAERRCRRGAFRIRLLRWARKAGIKL